MFNFLKSYGKVKTKDTLDGIASTIIKMDLNGATQAQLDVYYGRMEEMSAKVVDAKMAYDREQAEAEAATALYNQKIDVARVLQGRLSEADEATKEGLTKSLTTVLNEIDEMKADVEREKQEAVDAKELMDSWISSRDAVKAKLDGAQANLKKATARIAKAQSDRERSEDLLDARKAEAGLAHGSNDMDIVLNTMDKIASKDERKTQINREMAESLAPKKPVVDDNIQSALDAVQGKKAPASSIEDRLSSLSKL